MKINEPFREYIDSKVYLKKNIDVFGKILSMISLYFFSFFK